MFYKLTLFVVFGLHSSSVFGQWSFSEVIGRLSQEKAKVVSYRLTMNQTPIGESKTFSNCTWIEEKSNLGEHHVLALVKRNGKGEATWRLQGNSDDVVIIGSSETGEISYLPREKNDRRELPKHIDWRLLGLGVCGDIGDTFENVCTNIANWDKDFPNGEGVAFTKTPNGIACNQSDIHFEAEIADGFRMTVFTMGTKPDSNKVKSRFSEWKVEYKKHNGIKLPSVAFLTCGQESARIDCVWEMVNEPFPIGPPTVGRFATVLTKLKVSRN